MLFALEVVIEPRKGDARRTADIANRSGLKAAFGENLRGNAQDELQLSLRIAGDGGRGSHFGLERSFDNFSRWPAACQDSLRLAILTERLMGAIRPVSGATWHRSSFPLLFAELTLTGSDD